MEAVTEITDEEAAEVQWTSSEEGKAAFWAAWGRAKALGIDRRAAGMADVSAIVYAAHLAESAEANQAEAPAHLHTWQAVRKQDTGATLEGIKARVPRQTTFLLRCLECGDVASRRLDGYWTLEDLQDGPGQDGP